VFPLLVAYAAATDFLTMRIANRVSILLVSGFFLIAPFVGMTPYLALGHLAASLAIFVVGFGLFAMGWMGGGDVKFAAAVALWLGPSNLLEFTLLFSLFGGGMTIGILLLHKYIEPLPVLQVGFLAKFSEHRRLPYGIALSAAALLVYPNTIWMNAII
jgi:prepilin peptidase CpaA